MMTVVRWKQIGDVEIEPIRMDGRVPLPEFANFIHARLARIAHVSTHTVRITATGPKAGEVLVIYGPFTAQGVVSYER